MIAQTFFDRVRAFARRAFFWIFKKPKNDECAPETGEDHKLILSVIAPKRVPALRQLRYAARFLSASEKRWVAGAVAVLVLSLGLALGNAARQHTYKVPAAGGILTEALAGEPKYINPLDAPANDVDQDLASLIFSGLFRMNGMEPMPDLADSYSWSEDGKTLTVALKKNARFHNGDAVLADDVQFTIDSIQDPARTSPLAARFRNVKVIALDDFMVQFILEQPDITFLIALTVGILPATKWQDIPSTNARLADLNLKPIGSGPFQFKSFKRDSRGLIRSFTLKRFDDYYGNKPLIETLVFKFFPDRKQAEDALKADLVDSLSFVSFKNPADGGSRWNSVQLELPQETVVFFNLKDKKMNDKKVRQALAGVLDRQEIVTAWPDRAAAVSEPWPFAVASSSALNLDEGRELLKSAGWILTEGSSIRALKTSTSTELAINIIVPNQPELTAVAEMLKRCWSLLGAKISIEPLAPEELVRRATRERDAQIILTNILLDSRQDLFPFWWSGQAADRGLNISGLADRDVDNALEAARRAVNVQELEKARRALAALIKRSTPAVFLARPSAPYYVSKKIQGVSPRLIISQPSDRFRDLTNWYIKTGWRWKK